MKIKIHKYAKSLIFWCGEHRGHLLIFLSSAVLLFILPEGISRFQAYVQKESAGAPDDDIPRIMNTSHPVLRVPNWGALRTAKDWNRTYSELSESDFVAVPPYDFALLAKPMKELTQNFSEENIRAITAKLYYSTRFFGAYDLDAVEFTGAHPGIDLKLAHGTPVLSIADGKAHSVSRNPIDGLYIAIEHKSANGERFMSVYKHLDRIIIKEGDRISAGQVIGNSGMSGNASAPHLHLQVDLLPMHEVTNGHYAPYLPESVPTKEEISKKTVNPIIFIRRFAGG